MWKGLTVSIGVIIIIVANSFIWELIGLGLVIFPLLIPKRKRTFRRLKK